MPKLRIFEFVSPSFHFIGLYLDPDLDSAKMVFSPKEFKVLGFDIYGTLIDWETGIYEGLLPLLSKLPHSDPHHPSNKSPSEIKAWILSAYTQHELSIQKEDPSLPYPKVLETAYSRLATQLSVPYSETEAQKFGTSIGSWPAFPDTVSAMKTLAKHYKLIVLSNVDRTSFSRTLSGPLQNTPFSAIYTAQDIGSYKPDVRNFEYLIENAGKEFGAKKEEVLVVAQSLIHDHVPAKKVGLKPSVWIRRGNPAMGGTIEDLKDEVNLAATFGTLGELAEAVETAFKGDEA
jgi:2-haloalkanoic acid dehalogenase type II